MSETGFTFCVPLDWRDAGNRGWRGEGGSVTWTLNPTPTRVAFTVQAKGAPRPLPASVERTSDVEMVDGARVNVNVDRDGMTYRVRASFEELSIHFDGEGRGPAGEALLREIYRSVRVTRTR